MMSRHQHKKKIVVLAIAIISWANALTTSRFYKIVPLLNSPTQCYTSLGAEDYYANGSSNIHFDAKEAIKSSGLVSPYHVLHPQLFTKNSKPLEQQLPLGSVLRLLKLALFKVANEETNVLADTKSNVIRIEHKVSHTVDPLCWLHAQTQSESQHTSVYFATAEGTLEAAIYGSAKTYEGTTQNKEYWELVKGLPPRANFYGGQRFDADSEIGEEWSDFSKGMWVLPAIEIRQEKNFHNSSTTTTSVAVHLFNAGENNTLGFALSANQVLSTLKHVTDHTTTESPPTALPPVLSRASNYGPNLDGQEIYEQGVSAALAEFDKPGNSLKKVVLARRMDLSFSKHAEGGVNALDILRKWKFATKPGGHLFYINPGASGNEFFGCTPERLFQVKDGRVLSEALAGTRPRGSTQAADEELSRQLFGSAKDQTENLITGSFIMSCFDELNNRGWVDTNHSENDTFGGNFYVRRLRHLQHLCQQFDCVLADQIMPTDVIKFLFASLHPTPAVGGLPKKSAFDFIRRHETAAFDRGFYSGPFGFVSKDSAEIVVAIRSGLVTRDLERSKVSIYAGAGIVPGSTVQGEWAETSYKLAVVSSIFPQSPLTLQGTATPNAAWSTAFVEELVRNGVTQFYICPGSRSTPLVAAIAKAVRSNVGTVHALSVHDERGAGFRALGWGRGEGGPAAVVTSSGTAIANLYPAIIEAGMDGVPLVVVTADRPYESRDTGSNQAIDQVKAFSSSYIRWFRDILPPNDDVPISVALADAAHGVAVSRERRGPVHFNVQFRENLAPDSGPIRNDDRIGSITSFDGVRFTETPGFRRWSRGGERWMNSLGGRDYVSGKSVTEIGKLIKQSKRGIIVVGNLRKSTSRSQTDTSEMVNSLSSFASLIGFPIVAGVQSGSLRFESPAVIPFAEHLMRLPLIQENLKPDCVLQFGAPLVSAEVSKVVKKAMSKDIVHHILIHPHHPTERADPDFTVSHKVDAEILPFIKALSSFMETSVSVPQKSSKLVPLINLGRALQAEVASIVALAAAEVKSDTVEPGFMTEPEIILSLSKLIVEKNSGDLSLFLSNSMPVRDAEAFLYPLSNTSLGVTPTRLDTALNRGASGIDGIIASAAGFADSTNKRTTLLIGDVAALHDINSLHALRSEAAVRESHTHSSHAMTIIVVNNDGGGIFSFLPIANHGSDVAFEEFFGTPTNTFSFQKGAEAFGLHSMIVRNPQSFERSYIESLNTEDPTIIEAVVAPRDMNVAAHRSITNSVNTFLVQQIADEKVAEPLSELLPFTSSTNQGPVTNETASRTKTLVLLHGWMGDKSEWDDVITSLLDSLPPEWSIFSLDLPGHGDSDLRHSTVSQTTKEALGLNDDTFESSQSYFDLDRMAKSVCHTLKSNGIDSLDALAGYSLGGRVALAMKRRSILNINEERDPDFDLVSDATKLILVSAFPGDISFNTTKPRDETLKTKKERLAHDDMLSAEILNVWNRLQLSHKSKEDQMLHWSGFVKRWYSSPIWGNLIDQSHLYKRMVEKRISSLSKRGRDLAYVFRQCSPSRCRVDDWRAARAEHTLFISGSLDKKYSSVGENWQKQFPELHVHTIREKGHALLVEAPREVAGAVQRFLRLDTFEKDEETDGLVEKTRRPILAGADSLRSQEVSPAKAVEAVKRSTNPDLSERIGSFDFEPFSIGLVDKQQQNGVVAGIGWGDRSDAKKTETVKKRSGYIIQLLSADGSRVGIGEVSPFPGLHPESLEAAEEQLNVVAGKISEDDDCTLPTFDAGTILALDGGMEEFLDSFSDALGVGKLLLSVRSGFEMALVSLASQVVRLPIHLALSEYSPKEFRTQSTSSLLSLNGLITRGRSSTLTLDGADRVYESWKVKIGHQNPSDDAAVLSSALQLASSGSQASRAKVRADANRGFNETQALKLVGTLKKMKVGGLEYIEEPLQKTFLDGENESWTLGNQVERLERLFKLSSIPYALDESIFDLAEARNYRFNPMMDDLGNALTNESGCAALILKPSLLGIELSIRLARAARRDLSVAAVFTSSFDTGIGLSYASFLASLSDNSISHENVKTFSHGLGTFNMLENDTLKPPFGSYVNNKGTLTVASLSRAFYGLSLGEIMSLSIVSLPLLQPTDLETTFIEVSSPAVPTSMVSDDFEASTTISSDGREITVMASLPLPFSADIACARFTDLPQQPRWSPWISSVAYLEDGETEWTLHVRGISFRWRATSTFLDDPYKGIQWESVSGLKNTGFVEFIPESGDSCLMKVNIAFVTPRILSSLFRGTSIFFEDFLRNKILKWSLEMFRDVVKGDLALEEGNFELGDALFGSVEGKANAIEATLSTPDKN